MTILVTGAAGFLGSSICKLLCSSNESVVGLVRNSTNLERLSGISNLNIVESTNNLETILENYKVDSVIHLATNFGRSSNPQQVIHDNIVFSHSLVDICIKNNVRNFLNADTYAASSYSFYSATKKAFVQLLEYYGSNSLLNVSNVVLEYIYGPQDNIHAFVPAALKKIKNNTDIQASDCLQKRDFILVDDVAEAFKIIVNNSKPGFHQHNVGTGKSISIREFLSTAKTISGSKSNIEFGVVARRSAEIEDSRADNKSLIELGWKPKTSIEDGLKLTMKSL
jgi:nucleoside-diphosphate-sugar epimerase